MLETPEIKQIYTEIQNRLFYIIPEKWEKLCLYASVIEQIRNVPTGELYFYYFPKGILKKDPVNVYEVPNRFNINEDDYIEQIKELFELFKNLWKEFIINFHKRWYCLTITIENFKFKIEYNYKDIRELQFNQEQLHMIWAYKYLNLDYETLSKKNKKLIEKYLEEGMEEEIESYEESVYKRQIHNIISYQKVSENRDNSEDEAEDREEEKNVNNQILFEKK